MTTDYRELCEKLRESRPPRYIRCQAANLIESQAEKIAGYIYQHVRDSAELRRLCAERDEAKTRIKQQALEYVSLFDQCSQHLARIAELEGELEATRQERNAAGVRARQELMPAYELRIAELEKERDDLIHDNAQLVKAATEEATLASEAIAERDALKADAERWRIIESTLPTDELQDIAIIVAAEHGVNVENGFSRMPTDLLDTTIAALQAEKETGS